MHDQCGELDFDALEADVASTLNLVTEHPEIGALLFECTDLPPYAHAVQEATDSQASMLPH
ncbi:hypothetical protein X747_15285 [Mesorhizobium sp. LNJC384A00]|nr:hypothetical protein X747_15285 [Mesorhizobium sp. LNJC384A00]